MEIDKVFISATVAVQITGLSCKVILGSVPTLCPDADPSLPPTMLSVIPQAFQRFTPLPEGLTLHWVGHNAGSRNLCRCYPNAPSAAPADQDRWPVPVVKPVWSRAARQLSFQGQSIAEFPKVGANLCTILDTFHEKGWPVEIQLSIGGEQLYQAVRPLNKRIGKSGPIAFSANKSKKTVRWAVASRRRDAPNNQQ